MPTTFYIHGFGWRWRFVNHTLPQGVNRCPHTHTNIHAFLVRIWCNFVKDVFAHNTLSICEFCDRKGRSQGHAYLWAQHKLYLRVGREPVWHLESKERPGIVYELRQVHPAHSFVPFTLHIVPKSTSSSVQSHGLLYYIILCPIISALQNLSIG